MKKNRKTLINQFKDGAQPSEAAFADLIDSSINVVDDGFAKTDSEGFQVAQLGQSGKLMSFYENIMEKQPAWSLQLGEGSKQLHLADTVDKPVLTLSHSQDNEESSNRVGINQPKPRHALEVGGVVAASGRSGQPGEPLAADGEWQDLTEALEGCFALELTAGVGDKEKGRYALLHAIALNTWGKGVINVTQTHYGDRCDRLELRWSGSMRAQVLQIRTRCPYPPHSRIQFHLGNLWFDPLMQGCDSRKATEG
ncbi:MAG: hypothetical protein RIR00_1365 [Pseudomonadota bacterium]